MVLTRWFGVTESDADRCAAREKSDIEEIAKKSLLMQANAATKQHRSLCRGTHASGVCVRAQFERFDVTVGCAPYLAARPWRWGLCEPRTVPCAGGGAGA